MLRAITKTVVVSLLLLILLSGVALAQTETPTSAAISNSGDVNISGALEPGNTLSQGLDVYYHPDPSSIDQWFAALPEYTGILLTDSWDPATVERKDFKSDPELVARAVALTQKAKQVKNDGSPFQLWTQANLTIPTTIYNPDDTIYGYIYGVVLSNKLVGYIVAGANDKAPPILEYSLDGAKYLALARSDKAYFGRRSGFLIAKGAQIRDLLSDTVVCDSAKISELSATNQPTESEQTALDAQWVEAQQSAPSDHAEALRSSQVTATVASQATVVSPAPASNGVSTYVGIDTCDYTYYNICVNTALAMYVDALARRIEPGYFVVGHPHSKTINDYFNAINPHPSTTDAKNELQNYLTYWKLTSALSFSTTKLDAGDAGITNTMVFNQHKSVIDSGWPTMVGYWNSLIGQGHLMLGVGYTSDNYFICRDTWTEDSTPFHEWFMNASGYTYYMIWSTWTNTSPSTAWGSVTLSLGSVNFNVKRLEYFLNALYYNPGIIDNTFDTATQNAVKAFQSDNGLTADGVVGAATYAKLNVAHIMKYDTRTANWRVLSLNKKGDDVAQLQFRLQDRSLYSGAIDGIYGSGTQSAVIAFQHQKGLTEDGIAGSTTMWWLAYSP